MDKFNFKEWKDKKVVMHCKTEEEANEFCEVMHKAGKTWSSGVRYLERTNWKNYEDQTCYFFNNGTHDSIDYSREVGYKILEWSDYKKNTNSVHIYTDGITTTAILKDGKKTIRTGQAKCSPDDAYDFNVGARLAFDKLMVVESVREVKRRAKVGEWVKVINPRNVPKDKGIDAYKKDDILQIIKTSYWVMFKNGIAENRKVYALTDDEYVVLENYKPEIVPHLIHIDLEGTYGNIGDDTEQTDLLNNKLKVGDTAILYRGNRSLGEYATCKNERYPDGGVMSLMRHKFVSGKASEFSIIKHRGYEEIADGEIVGGVKYIKATN